ncbi:MAG: bacillithiol system redox-active protein YtxJ [Bacteroidota bacterium]
MGIFDSFFGKKENTSKESNALAWNPLTSIAQLEEIAEQSNGKPQLIFKHSTTCGISRMVLNMFTGSYNLGESADLHFLDLHAHRNVSNEVASRFGVMHQSPQLLIVKDGDVSFHTSHGNIADINLKDYI